MTTDWRWTRTLNHRALQSAVRRYAWLVFVAEFQKQLVLNYRRHLFPDYVIQAPPQPPVILTPTDLNRLLREKEEARKRLGL